MFDLNEKISMWRSDLAQSETFYSSDIDELESHLREEIENLTDLRLSDEEAFLVANHRLGSKDSLVVEYGKVRRGIRFKQKISWMITGVLTYLLATHFTTFVSKDYVRHAADYGINDYRSLGLIGFGLAILTLIAVFCLFFFFCKLILHISGLKMQIGQLAPREFFMISLLLIFIVIILYRVAFHVPVPGFKPMNIQQCVEQAFRYTMFLWSQYLPLVFLMLLLYLNKPNLNEEIE
jgi:hypothetical protein